MIFLILFFGALLILYLYLTWNFDFWQKQGVPSAKAQVLFGSLPNVLFQKEHMKYDVDKIYE
jgi:cytochrome P450 family 28